MSKRTLEEKMEQLARYILLEAKQSEVEEFFGYDPQGFSREEVENVLDQMPEEEIEDFYVTFNLDNKVIGYEEELGREGI